MRDHSSLEDLYESLNGIDKIVHDLLNIFSEHQIHATWAVVGFLFHESRDELLEYLPQNRNLYFDKSLNPYHYIENNKLLPDNFHFAKHIIKDISKVPFQEIASHTYSHYYCSERGQNEDTFRDDLNLFKEVSESYGYEVKTIVFPRNMIENTYLPILNEFGITAYRGNPDYAINVLQKKLKQSGRLIRFFDRYINISGHGTFQVQKCKESGLSNVKASRFLVPYDDRFKLLEFQRLKRIKKSMTYAAKNGEVFHLWWHPHNFGTNSENNLEFLKGILEHFAHLNRRYGMESNNMVEIAEMG